MSELKNCCICGQEPEPKPFGNDVVLACENRKCFMSEHDFTFEQWQKLMARPDADRVEWLSRQADIAWCVVVDRDHDGEYEIASDDGKLYYGDTFRSAIDEAMKGEPK